MRAQNIRHRRRLLILTAAIFAVLGIALSVWQRYGPRTAEVPAAKLPEELVFVTSEDDIVNGGVMFSPTKSAAKPIALIWIHGWGVNFYSPTYVTIGRALAERGFATIAANTRMHDIGTSAGERHGKRIRGGGYWGVAGEEVRDLAAWIAFAEHQGFKQIVLIGHSAGWAAVRGYQADTQDPRVVGLVLASGEVRGQAAPVDAELLAQANRLMADGRGDDLLRLPNRSFPSFVSAATFLDIAKSSPEQVDFFGVRTPNPAVTRVRCPILAFFGTRGDVGDEADLQLLRSSIERQSSGPSRVNTAMISNADHMYTGEEAQVAQTISSWAESVVLAELQKSDAPSQR
jgi:pimeloyl-ACP methyl ester carboxylesterase